MRSVASGCAEAGVRWQVPFRADLGWANRSSEVRELIEWILTKDPKKRPTAEQILQHKWMVGAVSQKKRPGFFGRRGKG